MGITLTENFTCDYCGKRITDPANVWRGRLDLRKPHARGLGTRVEIVLHAPCRDKLTANANKPAK
jgi:hypothetical protein